MAYRPFWETGASKATPKVAQEGAARGRLAARCAIHLDAEPLPVGIPIHLDGVAATEPAFEVGLDQEIHACGLDLHVSGLRLFQSQPQAGTASAEASHEDPHRAAWAIRFLEELLELVCCAFGDLHVHGSISGWGYSIRPLHE
jgi:hypothetical protein